MTDGWLVAPGRRLGLETPILMGILNVTPDSFSDGGRHATAEQAIAHGLRLVADGAAIVDVGGESTRPGAERVEPAEQVRRVVPVVEALASRTSAAISIDTTRADVAEAALGAGATIVNDVSAGTDDPALIPLVAARGCGIVLMHRRVPPREDRYSDEYDDSPADADVTGTVCAYLKTRVEAAVAAGVRRESIVIDPGLGFGKSVEQNYTLIRETPRLAALGLPVLSAASRKSFIGAIGGEPDPAGRLPGSIAVSLAHLALGVRLFRVHDVAEHRQALLVALAATGCLASGGV